MTNHLADQTWPEVAEAVADGARTVILPLGATEQHGPHLPMGTDTVRAQALAERLAAHLTDAIIAPALPIGCSDEHIGFAGLLSLEHETLASVIVDCARRMSGWGVRRLVLLSAHGGNVRAIESACARLGDELPELEVRPLGCSTAASAALIAIARADGISPEALGLHAGEGETSEMLCLRPDLVRRERIVAGYVGPADDLMSRLIDAGLRPITPTGTLGDARYADGSRGERYLAQEIADYRRCLAHSASSAAAKDRDPPMSGATA
ncbi:MAG: mycofactocin biosynthesis peptidyl-dipeptidase MftE [Rhodospirillales bacterium]|nr:mycofactocin biosynthesis peptidyl-dipeptidase MftE [Rhodospirillales bacterium]